MTTPVHRFLLTARPTRENKRYERWESADLCVLIREQDHDLALAKLQEVLQQHRCELLYFHRKDTLIPERVKGESDTLWDAYLAAQATGNRLIEFPQHFAAGSGVGAAIRPPRINESFVDEMVTAAGGRRLTAEERGVDEENADYLLDDFVIELKEIREEVFADDKIERQGKLAKLLIPYYPDDDVIRINPEELTQEDQWKFDDIVGAPVQTAIKKAARQIKATKRRLNLDGHRGALIVVNSGSYTLEADRLFALAKRYASKDTAQVQEVVVIDQGFRTNSFDSWITTRFLPPEPRSQLATRLMNAWSAGLRRLMSPAFLFAAGNVDDRLEPPVPIQFVTEGRIFSWVPEVPPPSCFRSEG